MGDSVEKKKKSAFIGALGNFSIQYNLSSVSTALPIMSSSTFPEPGWTSYTIKGLVFAGAVVGMCLMGYLGDAIGRQRALIVTLSLTVLGALGCALFPWSYDPNIVYAVICACRFVLGVGVGGIYPLSAVTASEGSASKEDVTKSVGMAFFWQTPGAMFPYLVGLLLLQIPSSYTNATQLQFRLLMGLGAIPAGIVLYASLSHEDSHEFKKSQAKSPLKDALKQRAYWKTLLGTAGTWFLYDVAYYGTNIFTPDIIESIFGKEDNIQLCWHSLVAQAIGIPGCLLGIWLLKPKGVYWLMLYGFWFIAVLFAAFAIVYNVDTTGLSSIKFVLYCALTFALNFGPNVATFVLPVVSFPPHVRSIFHGLSAASAKLGAVVGTYIFVPISDAWGVAGVMWLQVGLCVLGAIVTILCVQKDAERDAAMDLQESLHDGDDESDLLLPGSKGINA